MAEKFTNQAFLQVIESSANTLTFSKLETGLNIYEKVGWLISRIDYDFELAVSNFAAEADGAYFGISASDQITTVSLQNSAVIERNTIHRRDMGTAAAGMFELMPIIKDFSKLLGGGLLVPPNPIYIFVQGIALGSPLTVSARMFYSVVVLKTEDFWELVEQRRMIGV